MKVKKSKMVLEIKEFKIELTEEEAIRLRDLMNREFPEKEYVWNPVCPEPITIPFPYIPYYPSPYWGPFTIT